MHVRALYESAHSGTHAHTHTMLFISYLSFQLNEVREKNLRRHSLAPQHEIYGLSIYFYGDF